MDMTTGTSIKNDTNTPSTTGWRRMLPIEFGWPLELFRRVNVLSVRDVWPLGIFITFTVAFEGLGAATLLPILEYVKLGGDITSASQSSLYWGYFIKVYALIGIPINLATLSGVALLLIFCRQAMSYLSVVRTAMLVHQTEKRLAEACFKKILASHSQYVADMGSGSFIDVIYQQCLVSATSVATFATVARFLMTIVAYSILMVVTTPLASALAAVVVAIAILSVSRFIIQVRRITAKKVAAQKGYAHHISERYHAWRLIKLSDTLAMEFKLFEGKTQGLYDLAVDIARTGAKVQLIVVPVMATFVLASLYVSVELLSLDIARVTLFVFVLFRVIPIAEGISRARQGVARHIPPFERVAQVIADADANSEPLQGSETCPALSKQLTFSDIWFAYQNIDAPTLQGINVTIPAHKMTAIVGASGAGKSTLISLISGMTFPNRGSILWDDQNIDYYSLSSRRRQIAVVSQSPDVFSISILENIRYARPDASEADVVEVCRAAFADDFIQALPDGYQTNIGEGGARLSGGQLQRLVLARALLEESSIIILDEPTSALDYNAERKVQEAINNLVAKASMTVVVIAHRLSTIRNADYFIALKDGRVSQSGPTTGVELNEDWYAQFDDGLDNENSVEKPALNEL